MYDSPSRGKSTVIVNAMNGVISYGNEVLPQIGRGHEVYVNADNWDGSVSTVKLSDFQSHIYDQGTWGKGDDEYFDQSVEIVWNKVLQKAEVSYLNPLDLNHLIFPPVNDQLAAWEHRLIENAIEITPDAGIKPSFGVTPVAVPSKVDPPWDEKP